jgi:hypothetical protein
MALTLRSARREFSEDHPWPTAESKLLAELEQVSSDRPTKTARVPRPASATTDLNAKIRPSGSNNKRPLLRQRVVRGLSRFLIIFGVGVATTLAWQSYGNEIRATIAISSPQLGWLAPQAALAETPAEAEPIAPAAASAEMQQLEVMSIGLAAMQQSIDQLAASQQQMASEIAGLKRDLLAKLSSAPRPVAAPVRKPTTAVPPPSLQESPER